MIIDDSEFRKGMMMYTMVTYEDNSSAMVPCTLEEGLRFYQMFYRKDKMDELLALLEQRYRESVRDGNEKQSRIAQMAAGSVIIECERNEAVRMLGEYTLKYGSLTEESNDEK